RWALRIGLRQVAHVGDELAQAILWERRGRHQALSQESSIARTDFSPSAPCTSTVGASGGRPVPRLLPTKPYHERPFTSLAAFRARLRPVGLRCPAAEALVLAGAFDGLAPAMDRRQRLWHLHEIWPMVGATSGTAGTRSRTPRRVRDGA